MMQIAFLKISGLIKSTLIAESIIISLFESFNANSSLF